MKNSIKKGLVEFFLEIGSSSIIKPVAYVIICHYEAWLILSFLLAYVQNGNDLTVDELNLAYYIFKYLPSTGFFVISSIISVFHLLIFLLLIWYFFGSEGSDREKSNSLIHTIFIPVASFYFVLLIHPLSLCFSWIYLALFQCDPGLTEWYPDLQCWNMEHSVFATVGIVGFSLMIFELALCYYFFQANSYPGSPRPWAGLSSCLDFPRHLCKLLLVIFRINEMRYSIGLYVVFIYFAFQLATYRHLIYNSLVMNNKIFDEAILGFFAFGLSVSVYCSLEITWIGLSMLCVASLIFSLGLLFYKEIQKQRIMELEVPKLGSCNNVALFMIKVLESINAFLKCQANQKHISSAKILCKHRMMCESEDCDCRKIEVKMREHVQRYLHIGKEKVDELSNLRAKEEIQKNFIKVILKDVLMSYGEKLEIRLLASYVEDRVLKNYIKGYFHIMMAEEGSPSLSADFCIAIHRQAIEQGLLIKKQEQGIDVVGIWKFENCYSGLLKQISISARKCLDYWNELLQVTINVPRLYKKSIRISELYLKITSIVKEMLLIYPNHTRLLRDYARFLSELVNNDLEAAEFFEHASSVVKISSFIRADLNLQDIKYGYNSNAVAISVSGNIHSIGLIQNVNDRILQFGYSKSEIIGNNISMLLPKYIGDRHNSFISSYFDTGEASLLDEEKILFLQHKNNYIIPVKMLLKCLPNLKEGLYFLGFIKQLYKEASFLQPAPHVNAPKYLIILTTDQGFLIGYSKKCFKRLGFVPSLVFDGISSREGRCFSIGHMNPQLLEPRCENKMMSEGLELNLNTECLLNSVELERLSQEEAVTMANTAGLYLAFVQLIKYQYKKINYRVYRVAIKMRIKTHMPSSIKISVNLDDIKMEQKKKLQEHCQRINIKMSRFPPAIESVDTSTLQGSTSSTTSHYSKTIKEFKRKICSDETPRTITLLNRAVIILLFLLICLAIVDLFLRLYVSNNFIKEINTICVSNNRRFVISDLAARLRSLANIGAGLEKNEIGTMNRTEHLMSKLRSTIIRMQNIQRELDNMDFQSSDRLNYLVHERTVEMKNLDPYCSVETVRVTLSTAMSQIVVYTNQIINSNLSLLLGDPLYLLSFLKSSCNSSTLIGRAIFFILENSNQAMRRVALEAGSEYVSSALENANTHEKYLLILTICSAVFVICCVGIVIPILLRAERNKVVALSIYSKLSVESAKQMLLKCKNYIENSNTISGTAEIGVSTFQRSVKSQENAGPNKEEKKESTFSEEEDSPKEEENKEQNAEHSPLMEKEKPNEEIKIGHKDSFKKFKTNIFIIILSLSIIASLILGYLGLCYYLSYDLFTESRLAFHQVFYVTGRSPAMLGVLIMYRELIISGTRYLDDGQDLLQYYLSFVQERERTLQVIKAQPSEVISKSIDYLKQIDSSEMCSLVTSTDEDLEDCLTINGKILRNGMKSAMYSLYNSISDSRDKFEQNNFNAATCREILNCSDNNKNRNDKGHRFINVQEF